MGKPGILLVHDYITQAGGAERVLLILLETFGNPPVYTSLFDPGRTFPEFGAATVRTTPLNHSKLLREHHRLAFPMLATAFSNLSLEADTVICSSSGWAHGTKVDGRKIVYCYSPARWLYQTARYAGQNPYSAARLAGALAGPSLRRWDRRAARTADTYVTLSRAVAREIERIYGIEAEVIPPPPALSDDGERNPVANIEPGFYLCVARLLRYKNVEAVTEAFRYLEGERLVVVGMGPRYRAISSTAPPNVKLLGRVTDPELKWLYEHCHAVIAAAYEDYGLAPLEGAVFGKPSVALRWGGFVETVVEDETGVFFDHPLPSLIAEAVRNQQRTAFDRQKIRSHVSRFSKARFMQAMRDIAGQREDETEV